MLEKDGFEDRRRSSGDRLDTVGAEWREKKQKQLVCQDILMFSHNRKAHNTHTLTKR